MYLRMLRFYIGVLERHTIGLQDHTYITDIGRLLTVHCTRPSAVRRAVRCHRVVSHVGTGIYPKVLLCEWKPLVFDRSGS